ncbi:hypothetical protein MKX03_029525, partial [Papaver bracteatum]
YWVNALPISIKDGIPCYWYGSLSITLGGGSVYEWFDQKHMGVISNDMRNTSSKYIIADTLAQRLNSASEATTIQGKEEFANYIQLTTTSYDEFWIIMHELKVIASEIFQMDLTREVCLQLQLQMQVKYKCARAVFTNFNFQVETHSCEGTITHTDNARSASITYQTVSPDASGFKYWARNYASYSPPEEDEQIWPCESVTPYIAREGDTLHVFSCSFAHFLPSILEDNDDLERWVFVMSLMLG